MNFAFFLRVKTIISIIGGNIAYVDLWLKIIMIG